MEIDEKLQKWYKILDFALIAMTIGVIMMKSTTRFITYFTTDLSVDAFELPIPSTQNPKYIFTHFIRNNFQSLIFFNLKQKVPV